MTDSNERDEARDLARQLANSIRRWIAQDEYDHDGLGDALTAYETQSKGWSEEGKPMGDGQRTTKARFYLFGGAEYYANGGQTDYIGAFDTVEAAKEFDRECCEGPYYAGGKPRGFDGTWAQIAEVTEAGLKLLLHRGRAYGEADDLWLSPSEDP